jgi:hypothetical protein
MHALWKICGHDVVCGAAQTVSPISSHAKKCNNKKSQTMITWPGKNWYRLQKHPALTVIIQTDCTRVASLI